MDENGWFKLSDNRGKVIVLDFMAIDCVNCHYVQEHLEKRIDYWTDYDGDYEIIVVSVGMCGITKNPFNAKRHIRRSRFQFSYALGCCYG